MFDQNLTLLEYKQREAPKLRSLRRLMRYLNRRRPKMGVRPQNEIYLCILVMGLVRCQLWYCAVEPSHLRQVHWPNVLQLCPSAQLPLHTTANKRESGKSSCDLVLRWCLRSLQKRAAGLTWPAPLLIVSVGGGIDLNSWSSQTEVGL